MIHARTLKEIVEDEKMTYALKSERCLLVVSSRTMGDRDMQAYTAAAQTFATLHLADNIAQLVEAQAAT